MSSGCGDVLSLEDLKIAKQHQVFEAEVITGLSGGVPGGTAIDYATNPVTGQVQKTLPAVLRDLGFRPASFTFVTGGTLAAGSSDVAVLWPVSSGGDGNYYVWKGAFPKVVPAASAPATTGGVSSSAWMPVGDVTLRKELGDASDVLKGDALLAVKQPYTGAVARTQHDKNKESVSVMDFGAKGDGVTDDSAAFNAALAASNLVIVPYTSAGYVIANIDLNAGKRLIGESRVQLLCTAATCFNVKCYSISLPAEISGFTINMNGSPTNSVAVLFKTSAGVVYNFRSKDMCFMYCYGAYSDEVTAATYVVDALFEDINCIYTKGRQITLNRSRGFITFRDTRIDHTLNTWPVTWGGFYATDVVGLELEKFDVVGPVPSQTPSVYQPSSVAIRIIGAGQGKASVWLRRVLVDNTMGLGMQLGNLFNVFGVDVTIFQNLGQNLLLEDVTESQFVNLKSQGGVGLTNPASGASGITLNRCKMITMTSVSALYNTGNGITINDSEDVHISSAYFTHNVSSGVSIIGVSKRCTIHNFSSVFNTLNSAIIAGASNALLSYYPQSGNLVDKTVGDTQGVVVP